MNTKRFLFLTIMQVLVLACKKEKKNDDNFIQETPTAVITAVIDGQEFQALSAHISVTFDSLLNRHILTATNPQGQTLTLEMSTIQVGQYPLDFDQYLMSLQRDSLIFDGGNSPLGSIEISSVQSGKFSGTFSATLRNLFTAQEVLVTNGIITTVPY